MISHVFNFTLDTACIITGVTNPEATSYEDPTVLIVEVPFEAYAWLPLYEPDPVCNSTNFDLSYEITGTLPVWLTFNTDRSFTALSTDTNLTSTEV
jgi:hypothetical protein